MSSSSSKLLVVAPSLGEVPTLLNDAIVKIAVRVLQERNAFTIALSGGSLPKFLSKLPQAFQDAHQNPHWDKWHILLADERCVPMSSEDSNMGALQEEFLRHTSIPASQIHGIDEEMLVINKKETDIDTALIAKDYETKLLQVLAGKDVDGESVDEKSMLWLDLAVLGFGPDGHTCSLFPGHKLLQETSLWVAPIDDSPKPPPKRITLTLKVLNKNTQHVIFCGAGASKQPVVEKVFSSRVQQGDTEYSVEMTSPPPYPCAMVQPLQSLTWIVDADAMGSSTTD